MAGQFSALALMFIGVDLRDFTQALCEASRADEPDRGAFDEAKFIDVPPSIQAELAGWEIEQWWAASRRWHQAISAAGMPPDNRQRNGLGEVVSLSWLPLVDAPFGSLGNEVINGIADVVLESKARADARSLHFVVNSRELEEEGNTMDHCVSTYVDLCFRGRRHVASVRDGEGHRCSTVAFHSLSMVGASSRSSERP